MSSVFVTGATGLTGANVCKILIERGDHVRALARPAADTEALSAMGVELVDGDVTDADSVLRAARGCESAIHCAALLGGASQDVADFQAVNVDGTRHVLDAAAALGMRRTVALSTGTFFDTTGDVELEEAPIAAQPSTDPYTVTKLAAFREATARAAAGQDVVTCHPGAIFGPSPVLSRALHRTSFNNVLLAALRKRFDSYLRFPITWVFADDVARGAVAALDRGVSGERYMLDGRPQDVMSVAACSNRCLAVAGISHRIEDVEPSWDPALVERFGPTLVAIATAERGDPRLRSTDTKTSRRLGYVPTPLDDGLRALVDWLRLHGKVS